MSILKYSRRQFLRTSGGFILAIPFLPSLAEKAQAAEGVIPKRFVTLRSMFGQPPEFFYPLRPTTKLANAGDHAYYRAFQSGETLSTLLDSQFSSLLPKLSLIRGLDLGEGGHNDCMILAPGKLPLNADGTVNGSVSSWKSSLDMVLANSSIMYPATPNLRSLLIQPAPGGEDYNHSFSILDGVHQPYSKDISKLFSTLFKKSAGGTTTPVVDSKNSKILKAVDLAKSAYDSIRSSAQISKVDKERLDRHIAMVNDVENRLSSVQPQVPLSCNSGTLGALDTFDQVYTAANDIVVLALSCGMTQVVSLSYSWFQSLANETHTNFHDSSHWTYGGQTYPSIGAGEEYKINSPFKNNIQRMWSLVPKKVADLMKKMDSVTETNGKTLLDNSLVYWGCEYGAADHGAYGMPILVGGTLNGAVNPGYYDFTHRPFLYYAGRSDIMSPVGTIPYTNFLTSLAYLYGLPASSYEKNNQGGFGDFETTWGANYSYQGTGPEKLGAALYSQYTTTAGRRKLIPGWVKT